MTVPPTSARTTLTSALVSAAIGLALIWVFDRLTDGFAIGAGAPMSGHGYAAILLAVLLTLGLTVVLGSLMLFSHRTGVDAAVDHTRHDLGADGGVDWSRAGDGPSLWG
ncbi:hypothetical protein F1188_09555 [Roseospira marina]|uniref:Uncharacterized protein n=1 Tax=Roseospira marina TaxID=140057 RepID=A0A5M6IC66_9PROT|nr:hypothetical protein [Roseospira marina]KAA5605846.1 hypothetical protein F1188_09555 [Roseospira marina]MBB4313665.1 hypothetical protein [Roseospira marina]MBB5086827.1 hypothetical protein [Roseospira marina]